FIKSAVAAGRAVPATRARETFLLGIVPASARVRPTAHASSPYEISEDQKADRPPDHEAQDHEGDPDRLRHLVEPAWDFIELRGDIHGEPHVNVSNIYMRYCLPVVKGRGSSLLALYYYRMLSSPIIPLACASAKRTHFLRCNIEYLAPTSWLFGRISHQPE